MAEDFTLPLVKRKWALSQRCVWTPHDRKDRLDARREEAHSVAADAGEQAVVHENVIRVGLWGLVIFRHARVYRTALCLCEGSGVVGWWGKGD